MRNRRQQGPGIDAVGRFPNEEAIPTVLIGQNRQLKLLSRIPTRQHKPIFHRPGSFSLLFGRPPRRVGHGTMIPMSVLVLK